MSTADSDCDNAAGLSKSSNIWTHVTAIADSDLNPQSQITTGQQRWLFTLSPVQDWCAPSVSSCTPRGCLQSTHRGAMTRCNRPKQLQGSGRTRQAFGQICYTRKGQSPSITALLQRTRSWLRNVINSWHIFSTLVGLQERGRSRHFASQMGVIQCAQSMH